jgi:stage II sporulation protein D
VRCASPQVVEHTCKANALRFQSPKHQGLLFFVLLLVVSSISCGGRKAKVQRPLPRTVPAPQAKETDRPKQQNPKQPAPAVPENPPQPAVGESLEPGNATPPEPEAYRTGPSIRIGLTTSATEIRISSTGEYYVMDKKPESTREPIRGEIWIRAEKEGEENSDVYRIQVASFSNAATAVDLKNSLADKFKFPVIVRENSATGTNQVRIGEFPDKEDAQSLLKRLIESGYGDAFLVKDNVTTGGGRSALTLRGQNDLFRLTQAGFLLSPSSGTSFLCVDGKPYRGLLDVFLNKSGKITVVNQLGMEEYLLGVVPAEMSPASYPDFDALAAQAIVARTYALKNIGRYGSEGFDLSDDTRTQVYGGVTAEKDATNDAVRRTSGLAIYYEGKPIDAMYMSTCGGRTEDSSAVFDTPDVPYLKSVFCAIESGPEMGATVLEGTHELEQSIVANDGSIANRNIELARALGLIEPNLKLSQDFLASPVKRDEVVQWVDNARRIARKANSDDPPIPADLETRSGFLKYAAESFFGSRDIRRTLSTRDLAYYLGNLKDGDSVPDSARYALTYLMQAGLWRPNPDNMAYPDALVSRSDAIFTLVNWIEAARPDIMQKGSFVSATWPETGHAPNPAISIKRGNRTREYRLSDRLSLFRLDSGRITPVSTLKILGNENLSFHRGDSGAIDFLQIELSPSGASSDRYSPASSWDVTLTQSAVAEKLRSLAGNIGQFRDLKPSRLGKSGRAVQIQIIGSRNSVVVNGLKVRGALGLKDTLFTITREINSDGSVASFTFHGRGWGHGVGLCQVGAFGMARAGHTYEEIIKTYYQGVEIQKAY